MEILAATNPFDTVGGMPVHVLAAHVLAVLLPLCAIATIVMAIIPRFCLRVGLFVWIGAAVCFGLSFLAQRSGLALSQRVGTPAQHLQLGEHVKYFAAALTIAAMLLWIIDRQSGGARSLPTNLVAVVVVLVGVAAIYGSYVASSSGTKAVWDSVIANTPPAK